MSRKTNPVRCLLTTVALVVSLGMLSASALGAIWHVDADAAPGGDGEMWATAFKYLQDALEVVAAGDQIWVAEGTYYPDEGLFPPPGNPREATFALENGVKLYGGFVGTESSLPERDPETNTTTLSGDLNGNDVPADFPLGSTYADNAFHVVAAQNVGSGTVLNGFTITAGQGNGSLEEGGGLRIVAGSLRVVRCTFFRNYGGGGGVNARGGGVFISGLSSPNIVNCSFLDNLATFGAGVYSAGSTFTSVNHILTNCLFSGNGGGPLMHDGAGLYISSPQHTVTLVNCTFFGNVAGGDAGGIFNVPGISANSLAIVKNCVLWGNDDGMHNHCSPPFLDKSEIYAGCDFKGATLQNTCIQGGWGGGGPDNIDQDPLYCDPDGADDEVGTTDDNLRLSLGSPCIDAGLDSAVPTDVGDVDDDGFILETLPLDLHKQERFFDAIPSSTDDVDMGAYEDQHIADCPADFGGDGEVGEFDLAVLLGSWGTCTGCPADLNCDGVVEAADLAILLGSWGPCGGLGGGGGSAPEGPGGDDTALIEALGVMGFADVDEFNAWTASVPTDEAYAATQQLLELLTE